MKAADAATVGLVRLVRSLVAAGVVLVAVVGCSAEPEPAPPVAATSSSTTEPPAPEPEPSQTFTKPELPTAATTPDAAGAEAFIRYWYELVNYAYASGEGDALLEVSHVDCVGCVGLVDNIATATDHGAVWRDMTFAPEQFAVEEPDADGISLATALLVASPNATVLEPDGTVVAVEGVEVETIRFWAQWTGDHWQTFAINYPDRPA